MILTDIKALNRIPILLPFRSPNTPNIKLPSSVPINQVVGSQATWN